MTRELCRALNPERTHMCELDRGHVGDHVGDELPTIVLDEGDVAMSLTNGHAS